MQHNFTGKFFLLSLLLFFVSFAATQAQSTSLYFEDQEVEPGTMVNIDLKVSDFQNMLGMQFSINWNPEVLSFQNVEDFGLEDITLESNFGLDSSSVGRLGFLWIDNSLAGVALPDSSVLFAIKFMVIGNPDAACDIVFSDIPTLIELSDDEGVIDADMVGAVITVAEPNSTFAPDHISVIDCYPNPFASRTTLEFQMDYSAYLTISIKDVKGKVVHEQEDYFQPGKHQIVFNKDLFPTAGIFFCELISSEFKVSQKLIRLND
jgi:hypothetical protein